MSITVISLPVVLAHLGVVVAYGILSSKAVSAAPCIIDTDAKISDYEIENFKNGNSSFCMDENNLNQLEQQEFETAIVDRELLIKTLNEHGALNIKDDGMVVTCDVIEGFNLFFSKVEPTEPYKLKISYGNNEGLNELVENIGDEYVANVQEASYNKIVERLKEKNLEIVQEEIEDDNTIVLTVNLE